MNTVFAKIVSSYQRNWCQLVDHVAYAYNSATHSSSLFTPYYLMHLWHPRVPLELLIEKPTTAAVQSTDDYMQQTADRMRCAYSVVCENLKAAFERNKKRYDARVKTAQLQVGDFVFYHVPHSHAGKNRKWALDNRGPFRVQRRVNDVNYAIQKSPTSKPLIVHIARLTKFRFQEGEASEGHVPPVWQKFLAKQQVVNQEQDVLVERTVDNEENQSTRVPADTLMPSDNQAVVTQQNTNPSVDVTQLLNDKRVGVPLNPEALPFRPLAMPGSNVPQVEQTAGKYISSRRHKRHTATSSEEGKLSALPPRRPKHTSKRPAHLKDFVCTIATTQNHLGNKSQAPNKNDFDKQRPDKDSAPVINVTDCVTDGVTNVAVCSLSSNRNPGSRSGRRRKVSSPSTTPLQGKRGGFHKLLTTQGFLSGSDLRKPLCCSTTSSGRVKAPTESPPMICRTSKDRGNGRKSFTSGCSQSANRRGDALGSRVETARGVPDEGTSPMVASEEPALKINARVIFGRGVTQIRYNPDEIDIDFWPAEGKWQLPSHQESTEVLLDVDKSAEKVKHRQRHGEPPSAAAGGLSSMEDYYDADAG